MEDTQTQTMARSTAEVATELPQRYLTQLCKHFEHKLAVSYDGPAGEIVFSVGTCHLRAGTGVLTLSLEAPDAASLAQLQDVVARHLLRFAFREDMHIGWHTA
jgi:hypothetical protein